MSKDAEKHPHVDGWLRQVFPDDLPAEVEARMAAHLDRFRKDWENAGKARDITALRPRLWSFAPVRIALVAASACLVLYGFSLRPKRTPTALASSLATLQKAASVAGQVGSGRIMECTVHFEKAEIDSPRFVIRWVSPEETLVRIVQAGEESLRTIRPQKTERSVLEFVTRPTEDESEELSRMDPELLPVEELLTASRLRRFLAGRWLPAGIQRIDGCDWESFSIAPSPGEPPSRVTVDTCTFLPMKLEKDLDKGGKLEAVFHWPPRSGPGSASGTIPS